MRFRITLGHVPTRNAAVGCAKIMAKSGNRTAARAMRAKTRVSSDGVPAGFPRLTACCYRRVWCQGNARCPCARKRTPGLHALALAVKENLDARFALINRLLIAWGIF